MQQGVPAGGPEAGFRPYVPRVVLRHFAPDPGGPQVRAIDATLAFADVSGFTKLAERLARQGREGAEQLTGVIGRCFDSLLAVAYANGGSLVKFGGDALLLLFEDEHHTERACPSALGMQTALRELGPVEAGGAKVRLRMSMGIHSGEVHLFLAGTSHREVTVSGPAASAMVRMEKEASAGETVLSPATAARLPAACVGAPRGGGVLLRRAPIDADLAPAEPTPAADPAALSRCLSTAVREHVRAGDDTPEHRTVAVAFVQYAGMDAILEREGAEAAAAALHGLVDATQRACDEHRVTFIDSDVDADGGKLLLAAGAPRAVGDDEERLLLALRQVLAHETPLRTRAGVNRGGVFAGAVGPAYRRAYTVMGDPTNLAARVMAKAEPGTLLATPAVLDRARTRFATTPVEPFMVKGKSRPIEAAVVGPVLGRDRAAVQRSEILLVGRSTELAALADAAAAARSGRGGLVEIMGEPGLGKTRLLEELRAQASDVPRVQIVCEAYTASTPYAAARELLRPVAGLGAADDDATVMAHLQALVAEQDPSLAPWVPLLAIACGADAAPTPEVAALGTEFRKARLHEAVTAFLSPHLSAPLLVEIEDAQCMDAASAELLHALQAPLAEGCWLVAVTRRDGDGGFQADDQAVLRLHPEPLVPADTRRLAEILTEAEPLRPDLLELAVERSGGNPQFLRDLVRAAAAGAGELPDSIEAAATARIDRLAPDDRMLVRRAAVLGVSFRPEWLGAVLADEDLIPGPAQWERLDAYFEHAPDGAVHFRRAVVREVAYAGLPFSIRRRLHASAASRIVPALGDRPDLAAVLSLHCLLAGDAAGAWEHGRAAADLARAHFAHADAARLYKRALDAAQHLDVEPGERALVWESLGYAHEALGDPVAATAAWNAARRLVAAEDPVLHAKLIGNIALLTMDAGGTRNAVRWGRRGLRVLESETGAGAGVCRAGLTATLATIRQRQGRMQEAARLARTAIAEAERVGAEAALARASYVLDWALVESGLPPAGGSERALEIYERLGETWRVSFVLNNLGNFAYRDGRWEDAIALWGRAGASAEHAGDVVGTAYAAFNVGELRSDQGRFAEAEASLTAAIRIARATHSEWPLAYATMHLGHLYVRDGRHPAGRELLREAAQLFKALSCEADEALAHGYLAEAAVFSGEGPAALAIVDAIEARSIGAWLAPLLHRVRGLALAQSGEVALAQETLLASLDAARGQGARFDIALALDALEGLAPGDAERRCERDALLERLGVVALPQTLILQAGAAAPQPIAA